MSYIFEKKKLYNYLGSSLVDTLQKYNAYVAGGAVTSLLCNRDINDVDIYFRNKNDAGDFVGEIIESSGWIISHTKKATAFRYNSITCQVIHFDYFETPEDIFKKFDYTICMGVFDFSKEEFVFHEDFFKHNVQKLLKFNEDTAYPIISALRIQKYEDKGYTISKPEYIKVLLTCMNLKIDNYEDLKEQMGGMYGVNYDKLLKPEDGKEFNLSAIISKLSDLILENDYFNEPEPYKFPDDIDDLVYEINETKIKVFKFKNKYFKYKGNIFEYINKSDIDKKEIYELVDADTILHSGIKFYKFVQKTKDNKYYSFYDKSFEYKIEEEVKSKKNDYSSGIYCGHLKNVSDFSYSDKEESVLIELELLDINDILNFNSFILNRAKVIREVPKEEYEKYL
jgi:hypothetical protein